MRQLQKLTLRLADPTHLLSFLVINAPHLFSEGLSAKRMGLGRPYSRTFVSIPPFRTEPDSLLPLLSDPGSFGRGGLSRQPLACRVDQAGRHHSPDTHSFTDQAARPSARQGTLDRRRFQTRKTPAKASTLDVDDRLQDESTQLEANQKLCGHHPRGELGN